MEITIQYQQNNKWQVETINCLSYEKRDAGIEFRIDKKKYWFYIPCRIVSVFDDEAFKASNDKWKKPVQLSPKPTEDHFKDVVAVPQVKISPDQTVCSFCNKPYMSHTMIHGTGPLQKSKKIEYDADGKPVEVIKHFSVKLSACRNCSLKLEPITRIECKKCGQTQRKCTCLGFDGHKVIVKQNCNTYSEG